MLQKQKSVLNNERDNTLILKHQESVYHSFRTIGRLTDRSLRHLNTKVNASLNATPTVNSENVTAYICVNLRLNMDTAS